MSTAGGEELKRMEETSREPAAAVPERGGSPPERPSGRRRHWWVLGLFAGTALAAGLGWYCWRWYTAPVPPEISLAGAEPAVAEAIETARAQVQREPRSAEAWGQLGLLLRAHGYDDESTTCFVQAERLDPRKPLWPYLQGLRLLANHPPAAIPFLERAVELADRVDRDKTAPRLLLAETLLQIGRHKEAERHFRRVLTQEPDNPRALYGLGLLASSRNDLKTAIAHLSRCLANPFSQRKACAQLAAIYQRQGDDQAAARYSRRASRLPKDQPWNDPYVGEFLRLEKGRRGRFLEAERLEAAGRKVEMARMFRAEAEARPDDHAYVNLGISLAKTGEFAEAEQVLRKAIQLAPAKIQAHYFLSVALFYQAERLWREQPGQRDRARKLFRAAAASALRATELKSDHAFAFIYRGLSLKYLGRRSEAITCFRTALRCRPEFVESHLYLGEALAESGQVPEALVHLRHAAQLAGPDDPRPAQALARVQGGGHEEK